MGPAVPFTKTRCPGYFDVMYTCAWGGGRSVTRHHVHLRVLCSVGSAPVRVVRRASCAGALVAAAAWTFFGGAGGCVDVPAENQTGLESPKPQGAQVEQK